MTLTAKQLMAAAAASRELAMECVTGTAPEFGRSVRIRDQRPWCAIGHVEIRAGCQFYTPTNPTHALVGAENDAPSPAEEQHQRLVFPLLALADELENAAEGRPQKALP